MYFYRNIILFPFTNVIFKIFFKYLFPLENNLSQVIVSFKILSSYYFFIVFFTSLTG